MIKTISRGFHTAWKLLRFIALATSSLACILSSLLPILGREGYGLDEIWPIGLLLAAGALLLHGILTHLLNDYLDDRSGTDARSPALLSGGSRIIQEGLISAEGVRRLGQGLALILLMLSGLLLLAQQYKLACLLIIGLWSAFSYSWPSLRLSYRPLVGEWLSLFPALFFLGLAGPWLILDSLPPWAFQNASINALVCMGWVMVHHIPDLEADRAAKPRKNTTVVYLADKFGLKAARLPASLYFLIAAALTPWVSLQRPLAAGLTLVILSLALLLTLKIDPGRLEQVTHYEKILLALAVMIALFLGIF